MRFRVEHHTRYVYDVPVALGSHIIRLLPQLPPEQLLKRTLDVSPQPTHQEVTLDANGNTVLSVGFAGTTQELICVSRFEAHTLTPMSAIDPGWPLLPWVPDSTLPSVLYEKDANREVLVFANQQCDAAGRSALPFLSQLNQYLHTHVDRHVRLTGSAHAAVETLTTMRGACRDLTTLFLAVCRAQGIAGRFVSGYQFAAETVDGQRHLHAWPEVFLPGYGWQGYDPTHGTAVGEGHVALCRGSE